MAKLPLQKNYYSRALKDMTENVMYNFYKGMGGIVQTGIDKRSRSRGQTCLDYALQGGEGQRQSSASMSIRGVSIIAKKTERIWQSV